MMDWRDVMEQEPEPARLMAAFRSERQLSEAELEFVEWMAETTEHPGQLRELVTFYRQFRELDALLRQWDEVQAFRSEGSR